MRLIGPNEALLLPGKVIAAAASLAPSLARGLSRDAELRARRT